MKRGAGLKSNPATHQAWQQRSAKRAQARAKEKGGKPLPPRNRKRAGRKYARNFGVDGRRGEAVRAMGCVIAGHPWHRCSLKIDAAHSTARGMGGTKGDSGDLWNGCAEAHREAGERGTSERAAFIEKYGIDPEVRAAEIKAELDERFGPEPCYLCGVVGGHSLLCPTAEGRALARAAS